MAAVMIDGLAMASGSTRAALQWFRISFSLFQYLYPFATAGDIGRRSPRFLVPILLQVHESG